MLKISKNIIFLVKNFSQENVYKQPWFWINELALYYKKKNFNVYIFTDEEKYDIKAAYKVFYDPLFFKLGKLYCCKEYII